MTTRTWTGNALSTAQVTTIAVSGTWATADTATLTMNGNDLIVTIGSNVATTDVAAAIAAAVNAASKTADLVDDESRNIGGQEIPEFTEIEAEVTSSTITLTGVTAGVPFTITASENTAGTGALGAPSTTAATGKWHWDNADNWTTATVPANTDDVVFNSGDVPVKYGLDQNSITLTSLTITQNYEGYIGVPETNIDNAAYPYREYRDAYLKISATTVNIGQGAGKGSGRIKLNVGTAACTLNVFNAGQTLEDGVESIQFLGTHASNVVNVKKGTVAIARQAGETATVVTLKVAYDTNPAGDANVRCGSGTTLTTLYCFGGITEINSAVTTVRMWGGDLTINGTGAVTTLDIDAGSVHSNTTGTITTATVGTEGFLDMTRDPRARTITTLSGHRDARYDDRLGVVTLSNAVTSVQCSLDQLRFNFGMNRTATISAPA